MLPALVFSQEDIERYKIYPTENIYTSLKLDTATGRIWQLQIGLGDDVDRVVTVLSDRLRARFKDDITSEYENEFKEWQIENPNLTIKEYEEQMYSLETYLSVTPVAQNGRYKLYPTDNMYNFILQDVINGSSYQVQWNNDEDKRFVEYFW